jgi:hypothetical protein
MIMSTNICPHSDNRDCFYRRSGYGRLDDYGDSGDY